MKSAVITMYGSKKKQGGYALPDNVVLVHAHTHAETHPTSHTSTDGHTRTRVLFLFVPLCSFSGTRRETHRLEGGKLSRKTDADQAPSLVFLADFAERASRVKTGEGRRREMKQTTNTALRSAEQDHRPSAGCEKTFHGACRASQASRANEAGLWVHAERGSVSKTRGRLVPQRLLWGSSTQMSCLRAYIRLSKAAHTCSSCHQARCSPRAAKRQMLMLTWGPYHPSGKPVSSQRAKSASSSQ